MRVTLLGLRNLILTLWVVLFFGAGACGHANFDPDLTVSPTFTFQERVALQESADRWNGLVSVHVTLSGGYWRVIRASPPPPHIGYTDAAAGIVELSPNLPIEEFRFVSLHELGHVIGLHHLRDGGVMTSGSGSLVFTRCDVIECIRVGACSISLDFEANECPHGPQ